MNSSQITGWLSSTLFATETLAPTTTSPSQQANPLQIVETDQVPTNVITPTILPIDITISDRITLDNVEKVTELNRWNFDLGFVSEVSWSLDSKSFAILDYDDGVYYVDLEDDSSMFIDVPELYNLEFAVDGELRGVGGWSRDDTSIVLWKDILSDKEGERIRTGHSQSISTTLLSPDGELFITGSYDNTIKVWQISDGTLLRKFSGHNNDIRALAISPDKKMSLRLRLITLFVCGICQVVWFYLF